jgi:osmotically-inducible protein OsmY
MQNNMARTNSTLIAVTAAILLATTAFAAPARTPQATDLTSNFTSAGITVEKLQVFEIGGIVVIRGRATDKAQAEAAGLHAQSLGYARVANLIQVVEPPDDEAIERRAERELTIHRSLDGCKFNVDSEQGILRIGGQVRHELQKDVAMQVLRNIDGVREVQTNLQRF